ncbi:MAG TPA: DUF1385 domain-containing protein [Ktedonobacterales bacterium]|nr:DUF1385 domain-containing protein [Ktedonobacterales bacterium]
MATFNYGGQAVVEGVMMRGRKAVAVAVRQPAGGILVHEELLAPRLYQNRVFRLPLLRGVLLLWDMLVLGTRMMAFAANVAAGQITDENGETSPAIGKGAIAVTLAISLAFAIGIFFLGPLALVGLVQRWVGTGALALVLEGIIRLVILLGYLWLIGRMPSIQRVFGYHGAEHKAINAFEHGEPLDVAHVRAASKVHTRCGTGFLLVVMVVSIVVFALVGNPPLLLRILSRIVLVPVVAAIAYELMRLGATYYRFRVVRWLVAPSLALQGLTTREPDDSQIECAISALERVLEKDGLLEPGRAIA